MKLDPKERPEHYDFVKNILGDCPEPARSRTFGIVDNDGNLRAVALFHDFNPIARRIEITLASDGCRLWLTKTLIKQFYNYIWGVLNVHRIQAMASPDNEEILKALAYFGFEYEARLTDWYGPHKDGLVFVAFHPNSKIHH